MAASFLITITTTSSIAAAAAPAAAATTALAAPPSRRHPSVPLSLPPLCSIPLTSKCSPANPLRTSNRPRDRVRASQSASSAANADSMTPAASSGRARFAVLFVCMGNICRSPAAEGVFRSLVGKKGLDAQFKIDSAGTIGYHEGNPADPRMRMTSKRRGIEITSISRPIRPSDFRDFDLILAMDLQNKDDLLAAYDRWRFKEPLPEGSHKKIKLICSYCKEHNETEVPDPYYGGPQGFEKVLDLLEDACASLLEHLSREQPLT